MDSVLTVVGFALGLAQVIVLLTVSKRRYTFIIATTVILFLAGLYGLIGWAQRLDTENGIKEQLHEIFASNNPLTIQQLTARVNENRKDPVTADEVVEAFEQLRIGASLCTADITTKDNEGHEYLVHVYNRRGFRTC